MAYNNKKSKKPKENPLIDVRAPYNFVSLPKKAIETKKVDIPKQNQMPKKDDKSIDSDLYSGYLTYTVTAHTDIMVGGYNGEEFYKNVDGDYAIPGSTMRGLIRNNMQILSLSSIDPDVDGDYLMMYRKVAGSDEKIKKDYIKILGSDSIKMDGKTVSLRKKVECGMLYFDGKKYWIIPSENKAFGGDYERQNYYILRESVIIGDLVKNNNNISKSPFYYLTKQKCLMHRYNSYPFNGYRGAADRGSNNRNFAPSYFKIAYKTGPNKTVIAVEDPSKGKGNSWKKGYFVSSGFMNNKKTHYVVPCEKGVSDKSKGAIPLDEKEIRAYEMDYEGRKNTLGTTQGGDANVKERYQKYNKLPDKKDSSRPVFYIRSTGPDGKDFYYFGFTPNLRLFYKHTIEDAIPKSNIVDMDFTRAMFGYSTGKESRKSRVSFEEAVIQDAAKARAEQVFTLGGPKPTSHMDYLTQSGSNMLNYNDDNIEIRGFKQYWLHEDAKGNVLDRKKKEFETTFKPLEKGCSFVGKIHFNNLKKEELGLLLWSILLEKDSQQNIGKAKSYGYGRISISVDDMKLYDYEKMYNSHVLDFEPYVEYTGNQEDEMKSYVNYYQDYIKKTYGIDLMTEQSIQRFFLMKDSKNLPSESQVDYMDVSSEYSKRTTALPYPEIVVKQNLKVDKSAAKQKTALDDDVVRGFIQNPLKDKKTGEIRGVFVKLPGKNGNGLLHISKMKNPVETYLNEGQEILVKIIKVESKGARNNYGLTDKDI